MKMLFFDLRESEKGFFEKNIYPDFDITFKEEALNEKTKLSDEEFNNTCILCVYRSSILTEKVLKKFMTNHLSGVRAMSSSAAMASAMTGVHSS